MEVKTPILLFKVFMSETVPEAVGKVLMSGYIGQGKVVEEFEKLLRDRFNTDYIATTNTGTSAEHLAIHLLKKPNLEKKWPGLVDGDEVLATPLTCTATNWPTLANNLRLKWVDIDEKTLNMDLDDLARKITHKTKIIMPVHWGGYPVDLDKLKEIQDKTELMFGFRPVIIEDCAHAFGSTYKNKPLGNHGNFNTFSFQAIKHLTCFPPHSKIVVPRIGRNGKATKAIKNIKVGDEVLTFNEKTSAKEYEKVVKTFEKDYNGNFIKLKLDNFNDIEMTEDHPVYVIEKGWVLANELKKGDRVLQYKYYGLIMRLNGKKNKGKSYEEIYGSTKGQKIRKKKSELVGGKNHFNYGNHLPEEWRRKISEAEKGKEISDFQKKQTSVRMKRHWKIPKNRKMQSKRMKKMFEERPELKSKISDGLIKRFSDPAERKKLSDRTKKVMETEEYWKKYYAGVNRKPNKSEKKLNKIIEKICPNEFGYNGDFSLGVSLSGLIPDFVNINGKKKVIELFGDYWHSEEVRGKSIDKQIKEKTKRYKKVGFDSLFIMESELKNIDELENKIKKFVFNPNVDIVTITEIEKYHYKGKVYNIETEKNHNYFAYGILVHNCVDGGMLITPDQEYHRRAKLIRWYGIDRETNKKDFRCELDIPEWGFKFHMNDVNATVGIENLKKVDWVIQRHRENADYYNKELQNVSGVTLLENSPDRKSSYWIYSILVERKGDFMNYMKEKGIIVSQVHERNDIHSCVREFKTHLPTLDRIVKKTISIPVGWWVGESEREYIVNCIKWGW